MVGGKNTLVKNGTDGSSQAKKICSRTSEENILKTVSKRISQHFKFLITSKLGFFLGRGGGRGEVPEGPQKRGAKRKNMRFFKNFSLSAGPKRIRGYPGGGGLPTSKRCLTETYKAVLAQHT